jgi:hypothetical protein
MQTLALQIIGPRTFMLLEDFKSECGITVPNGFVSDGLSVPAFLRCHVTPTDAGFNAAVVHDYLLKEGHSWEHANERFEAQLEYDEVPFLRRKLYILGVELWAMKAFLLGN